MHIYYFLFIYFFYHFIVFYTSKKDKLENDNTFNACWFLIANLWFFSHEFIMDYRWEFEGSHCLCTQPVITMRNETFKVRSFALSIPFLSCFFSQKKYNIVSISSSRKSSSSRGSRCCSPGTSRKNSGTRGRKKKDRKC